jgi:hypothetical protein
MHSKHIAVLRTGSHYVWLRTGGKQHSTHIPVLAHTEKHTPQTQNATRFRYT